MAMLLNKRTGRTEFSIQVLSILGLLWLCVRIIASLGDAPNDILLPFRIGNLSQSTFHALLWIPLILALIVPAALAIPRLRDAGKPTPFATLALIPGFNFVILIGLALLPPQEARKGDQTALDAWMPHGLFGSAAIGIAAGALIGAIAAGLASITDGYGAWLFLGTPFTMGLVAAWTVAYRLPAPVPIKVCLSAALLSIGLCALLILGVAIEGIICILMALPLAIPLAMIGSLFGSLLANRTSNRRLQWAPLFFIPAMFGLAPTQPPVRAVHSAIVIHAAPSSVWNAVVNQPSLPEPTDWVLRSGVGYPIHIDLPEAKVGAVRRCQFSTGLVLERIDGLELERSLHFTIFQQGPLMRELSPYRIQPRHLDAEDVKSIAGEFVLTPRSDGTTLLETTSWYSSRYAPAAYWSLLTDEIIHRIHGRVLHAIRTQAESGPSHG